MKYRGFSGILTAAGVLIALLLSSCASRTSADFDWDEMVREHLSAYRAEFSLEGPETDEENDLVLYTAVTQDENKIAVSVVCSYLKPASPIGGSRLKKERRVTDDFYRKVMDRISEEYGEKDLTDLSAEESVRYLTETIARAREMAEAYGIRDTELYGPRIRFVLTNGDRSWSAELREEGENSFSQLLSENLGKR